MLHMVQKDGRQQLIQESVPSCANSTVRLVFSVTQSDRDGAIDAVIAKRILQSGTSSLVTSFKTDNLGTRMLRPSPRPPLTILLTARSQCLQVFPLMTGPLPNCPIRDVAISERDKQLPADLRRVRRAMKALVGGAAQGSADCRKNWTTDLIPRNVPKQRVLRGELAVTRQGAAKQGSRRSRTSNWRP